jgi:hypothetical protein
MFVRYDYQPLETTKNGIRLLKIFPAEDEDDGSLIQGELIHTPLEDATFIALSYAWEDSTISNYPSSSLCALHFPSGSQLPLGRNLAAFLLTTRGAWAEKFLWIDALCINQLDVPERNREVTRMRYSMATDVVVWLGPEENDSDLALSLIGMIVHQTHTTNPVFEDFKENPEWPEWPSGDTEWVAENIRNGNHLAEWRAFNSMLERSWWVRVWMCQELALANNITFFCGSGLFSYHGLYSVIFNICQEHFDWIDEALTAKGISLNKGRLDIIFDLLILWNSADQQDLLQVLWFTVDRLATDERDKIYGILGIASGAQRIVPEADYSITVSDLYKNVAEAMVRERGDLDYLSLVFNRGNGAPSPPWMPTASRANIYMFNTSFFEPSMRSFSFHAANHTQPIVKFDANMQSFTAEGFIVDLVDGLGPSWSGINAEIKKHFERYGWHWLEASTRYLMGLK